MLVLIASGRGVVLRTRARATLDGEILPPDDGRTKRYALGFGASHFSHPLVDAPRWLRHLAKPPWRVIGRSRR